MLKSPKLIFIEGTSCCGKTTFLNLYDNRFTCSELLSEDNLMLECIHTKFGEMAFSINRCAQIVSMWHKAATYNLDNPVIYCDRSPFSSMIYSAIYEEMNGGVVDIEMLKKSILVVLKFLYTLFDFTFIILAPENIEACYKSLQKRGNWDKKFSPNYISLQNKYFEILFDEVKRFFIHSDSILFNGEVKKSSDSIYLVNDTFNKDGSFNQYAILNTLMLVLNKDEFRELCNNHIDEKYEVVRRYNKDNKDIRQKVVFFPQSKNPFFSLKSCCHLVSTDCDCVPSTLDKIKKFWYLKDKHTIKDGFGCDVVDHVHDTARL